MKVKSKHLLCLKYRGSQYPSMRVWPAPLEPEFCAQLAGSESITV